MDTLPFFRKTVHDAGLEGTVVAVVGDSPSVAAAWSTPLAFLFIDGGHGDEPAESDYAGWTPHVVAGGTFCIHDVFADPADGGQAPYEQIYRPALAAGFEEIAPPAPRVLLRRTAGLASSRRQRRLPVAQCQSVVRLEVGAGHQHREHGVVVDEEGAGRAGAGQGVGGEDHRGGRVVERSPPGKRASSG